MRSCCTHTSHGVLKGHPLCDIEDDIAFIFRASTVAGNSYSNFLAIDIEKNPSKTDADFGLSITMEPMEVVYHEVSDYNVISMIQHTDIYFVEMLKSGIPHKNIV